MSGQVRQYGKSGARKPSLETEDESGYASGDSTAAPKSSKTPSVPSSRDSNFSFAINFTPSHITFLNSQLKALEPQEILRWSIVTLPHLYQTTAFGLTGLAIMDMLSKLKTPRTHQAELIFLDTFYHFPETLRLVDRVRERYPDLDVHVFKPDGLSNVQEFEAKYGQRLWETDPERYDWLAKVEPARRSYRELDVNAILTGRRRSQGGKRGSLDILEIDENRMIKVNPLANWSFQQVQDYIRANDVPYNELLDRGYKSVGDWHSTQPVAEGENERAGRWKGQEKTECGIHNPQSKYAQFLKEQLRKEQARAAAAEQREQQQLAQEPSQGGTSTGTDSPMPAAATAMAT